MSSAARRVVSGGRVAKREERGRGGHTIGEEVVLLAFGFREEAVLVRSVRLALVAHEDAKVVPDLLVEVERAAMDALWVQSPVHRNAWPPHETVSYLPGSWLRREEGLTRLEGALLARVLESLALVLLDQLPLLLLARIVVLALHQETSSRVLPTLPPKKRELQSRQRIGSGRK